MKFTIDYSLVEIADEKIAKFKRKFDKFGGSDFSYVKSEPYFVEKEIDGFTETLKVVDVDVSGSYKVGDYEFVASLEFVPDAGENIVRKEAGTEDIPKEYLKRSACDHCKSNRFRKYTILLRDKVNGNYVQVGRQCVKDFIGCDASNYISYLSAFDDLNESLKNMTFSHRWSSDIYYDVDDILCQAVAEKNKKGYISNSMVSKWNVDHDYYEECPFKTTASSVYRIIVENSVDRNEVTDVVKEEVKKVREFVSELDESGDYIHNIKVVNSLKYVDRRNIGLVVSMVGFFLAEEARKERERKLKEASEASNFIGNIGDRITFSAVPKCVCSFETMYGLSMIYKFVVDGNEIVWNTKTFLEEKPVTIRATVKAHKVYRGVNQTEITRARVA